MIYRLLENVSLREALDDMKGKLLAVNPTERNNFFAVAMKVVVVMMVVVMRMIMMMMVMIVVVWFVALCPSQQLRSANLTTLFPGQA